ncbi:MAG: hypothetical protein OXR68_03905 [Alphaproteobacteria bacterium]|nr:hypothetical protein [Alphaproteobacteria bacterium]MDD9919750.1 hypothetical protein [Alphaproteobacteria bacterium]
MKSLLEAFNKDEPPTLQECKVMLWLIASPAIIIISTPIVIGTVKYLIGAGE